MPNSVTSPAAGVLNMTMVVGVEFPAITVTYPADLTGATITLKSVPDSQLLLTPLPFTPGASTAITIAVPEADTTAMGVTSFKYVLEYVPSGGGDAVLIFGGTIQVAYT